MDRMRNRLFGLVMAGAVAGALIVGTMTATTATAAPAAKVTSGHCSGRSTWKLTLKYDAGRIESDAEVQTPKAGQAWTFKMFDNGVRFGSGMKTTLADGSWSATRFAANRAGVVDHIKVTARNAVTGETCALLGAL